jgi:hypothetical protein
MADDKVNYFFKYPFQNFPVVQCTVTMPGSFFAVYRQVDFPCHDSLRDCSLFARQGFASRQKKGQKLLEVNNNIATSSLNFNG